MISFLFWFVYVYFRVFLRQGFSVCRFGACPLTYSLHKLALNSHRASCLCFQALGLKVWATTACFISKSKLQVYSEGLSEFIVYICKHYNDPMSEGSPWNLLLQSHSCFSDALAPEVELRVITTKGGIFPIIHFRGDDACYHEHPLSCI